MKQVTIDRLIEERDEMRKEYNKEKNKLEPTRISIEKLSRKISSYRFKLKEQEK